MLFVLYSILMCPKCWSDVEVKIENSFHFWGTIATDSAPAPNQTAGSAKSNIQRWRGRLWSRLNSLGSSGCPLQSIQISSLSLTEWMAGNNHQNTAQSAHNLIKKSDRKSFYVQYQVLYHDVTCQKIPENMQYLNLCCNFHRVDKK